MFEKAANGLKKAVFPASKGIAVVGLTVMVLMTLLTVADIISRRLANAPIAGSHELIQLAFAVITFTTLAYCGTKDGHIEVDILVIKFPKLAQKIIENIVLLFTSGVLGLVSWQLLKQGLNLQRMGQESTSLGLKIFPFAYLAALGTLLLTLVYLIRFLGSISHYKGE